MANIARVTQSFTELATQSNGVARVTQSFVEFAVGVGISCGNPPPGSIGAAYTTTFPAGGGVPPLTFSLISGTFPSGLNLNPATGVLSGTPTSAGNYMFTVQVADSSGGSSSVSCTIAIGGSIPSGGGQRAVLCAKRKNYFDWCMFAEALRYRKIAFPPLCSIPESLRQRYPLPWAEDFGANAIPEQSVPFSRIGSVVTPAAAAGDVLVTQERVPYGYDGLMMGYFTTYSGQGFEQGSGDIFWRIQLNQRYLRELGNLPFALGSSKSPCPLTEGQIVLSGQLMRLIVNVPNVSGNIQVGGSRILGGLIGFYWPR